MCDSGSDIRSLQFIDASGCKRFLAGGRVTGCYFVIEDPKNGVPAVSRRRISRPERQSIKRLAHLVAIAFNAGNLEPVAGALRNKFSDVQLIVLGWSLPG